MKIVDFLEDLTNVTKEEIEKKSISAPLDSEGHVQLTLDYWEEKEGIRYFKKPLMVDCIPWALYTLDCGSLVSELFGPYTLCIIAFSTNSKSTNQLCDEFFEEHLESRGYNYFSGFASEELRSVD